MKIKTTIILVFIIALIIASTMGLYLFYLNAEGVLKEQAYDHLESVAESRAYHIETFLEDRQMNVALMTTSFVYRDFLNACREDVDYALKYETVNTRLQSMEDADSEIFKSCILDKNGIIVASTDEESVGVDKIADDIFLLGREKTYINEIHGCTITDKPTICVSAPIRENNELLGVVIICSSIDKLNKITAEKSGLGMSEETYLVNRGGYRITPSRFMNDTFTEQKIDTVNARNCLLHKHKEHVAGHEVVTTYLSYRGTEVLGTQVFIEETGWCLLAEIDTEDVLGAQRTQLLEIFLLSVFIIIISVIMFSFLISRLISKPLEKLTETIEDISRGKMDVRVEGKERKDEIGGLARAFDRTLVSLKLAMKQTAPELKKESEELKKIIEEKEKAEEGLEAEKRYSRGLIEASIDPLVTFDREGIITDVNEATVNATGCSRDELIGTPFSKYFTDPKKAQEGVELVFEKGVVTNYELIMKSKTGEEIIVSYNTTLFHDENGDIVGVFAAARDITDRKKRDEALQKSEAKYTALFNNARDGILAADAETKKFMSANKSLCELTGYSEEELLKLSVEDIHPKKDLDYVVDQFTKQAEGKLALARDIPVLRKDKNVIYCDVNSIPIKLGDQELLLSFFREIEERIGRE